MAVEQATDVLIYIRASTGTSSNNLLLACMQNAVVNIDNTFLDITSKGDGKVGDLLQSGYNGTMQGSGVIQTNPDDTKISGPGLIRPTLNGSTCMITYSVGSLEMNVNAKIINLSYQSNVGSLWKFSATFQFTSEVITNELYDPANYYIVAANSFRRVSTTTESSFIESSLAGLEEGRLIVAKNGIRLVIRTIFTPFDDEVRYNTTTGEFEFDANLVPGDIILILYH